MNKKRVFKPGGVITFIVQSGLKEEDAIYLTFNNPSGTDNRNISFRPLRDNFWVANYMFTTQDEPGMYNTFHLMEELSATDTLNYVQLPQNFIDKLTFKFENPEWDENN